MEDLHQMTTSSFPMPPVDLMKMYSTENVKANLAPAPPPPILGQYVMFGQVYNTEDEIVQSLESQGIRRLYPPAGFNFDRKLELKKLNHSILANFLDLLEILVRCPGHSDRQRKVEELKLLFVNLHHLINEYRVHQARETLRLTLELQAHERDEIARRFSAHFDAAASKLRACLTAIPNSLCNVVSSEIVETRCLHPANSITPIDAKLNPNYSLPDVDAVLCKIADLV